MGECWTKERKWTDRGMISTAAGKGNTDNMRGPSCARSVDDMQKEHGRMTPAHRNLRSTRRERNPCGGTRDGGTMQKKKNAGKGRES